MTSASRFAWSEIDDEQFEELVFEVVKSGQPISIVWRKGPADKGRDVEALFRQTDQFAVEFESRVFVEAKHHASGVAPADIAGALAWAAAEIPNILILAVSGHITTACREHIAHWSRNNPRTRVQVWERSEIENRVLASPSARQIAVASGLLPVTSLALLPDDPTGKRSAPVVHGLEMEYRYWLTDDEAIRLDGAVETIESLADTVTKLDGIANHFELVCLSAPNIASFLRILQAQIRLSVATRDVLLAQLNGQRDHELEPLLEELRQRIAAVRTVGDSSVYVD